MIGLEMLGYATCVRRLIECVFLKADRERFDWPRRLNLHQRGNGGRIDSAREKRADRNIRDHLAGNALLDQPLELVDNFSLVTLDGVSQSPYSNVTCRPV